jgi:hypothetical protein
MASIRIQGAVVAITGGGGAIGRETAIMFAGAGARVAVGDLDGEAARATVGLIGPRARGYGVDVRDRDSMAAFLRSLSQELGAPRVFVNNAGVMPLGAYLDEDPAVTRRAVDVNLWGVLHGAQLAARVMVPRGLGHIVNVASLMGRIHAAGAASYGAAKHAVVGFGAAFGEELEGTGVSLTTILPTAVRTPLISGLAIGRFPPVIEPYEVAAAILDSCRHRRSEVAVPRWLGGAPDLERLLPAAARRALRRRFGGDVALHGVDHQARATYERNLRESELVA